jgi:hypothetical protein
VLPPLPLPLLEAPLELPPEPEPDPPPELLPEPELPPPSGKAPVDVEPPQAHTTAKATGSRIFEFMSDLWAKGIATGIPGELAREGRRNGGFSGRSGAAVCAACDRNACGENVGAIPRASYSHASLAMHVAVRAIAPSVASPAAPSA